MRHSDENAKKTEEVAQLKQKIKNLLKSREDVLETVNQLKLQKEKIEKRYQEEIEVYKIQISETKQAQVNDIEKVITMLFCVRYLTTINSYNNTKKCKQK